MIKSFIDFVQAAKDAGRERIKKPIATAFVISLLILQWRGILILLLSYLPIETRLEEMSNSGPSLFPSILLASLLACIYVIGIPWLSVPVHNWVKGAVERRIREEAESKVRIEKSRAELVKARAATNLAVKDGEFAVEQRNVELDKLRSQHSHSQQVIEKDAEIRSLNQQINRLQGENQRSQGELSSISSDNGSLMSQTDSLKDELRKCKSEIERMQRSVREAEKESNSAARARDRAIDQANDLQRHVDDLKSKSS